MSKGSDCKHDQDGMCGLEENYICPFCVVSACKDYEVKDGD